jgi:polar amino acid transport system substrate-binding protein
MTTRLTRTLVAGAGLVLAVGLGGCGSKSGTGADSGSGSGSGGNGLQTIEAGSLKVCSDIPYKPFDVLEGDTFTGFDGDLVNQVAKQLKLQLSVQDSNFDALQSGLSLNSSQCDMVASAMTITDERKQKIDFSEGYYDSEQSLLVPKGSDIASIDDLSGKRVGVQQGTTGKTYTEQNAPSDADIISFPSDAEEFNAIKAGQVDALLQDLPVNLAHTDDGEFEIVEKYDTGEQYGFAFKKGNAALVDAVNGALKKMRGDGSYDKIYNTYFSTK